MSPHNKNPRKKNSGQILILMALMTTTLVILLGFVINIGQLVQAKMNLQTAVDLAAMAGASEQAKHLNRISQSNYFMRQNYKFMLFDLYVTQSRLNKGFRDMLRNPTAPTAQLPKNDVPLGVCQQSFGYQPVALIGETGAGTDGRTDLCGRIDLGVGAIKPAIFVPPFDPVLISINRTIETLGRRLTEICLESAGQNEAYFRYATRQFEGKQLAQMIALAKGLEEFNKSFSNNPTGDLNIADILNSDRSADLVIKQTFVKNLLGSNADVVSFGYVNPPETRTYFDTPDRIGNLTQIVIGQATDSGNFDKYFEAQKVKFLFNITDFQDRAGSCQIKINTVPASGESGAGMFLGLSRSRENSIGKPKTPFFVAVKGVVRPKLLFWPTQYTPYLVATGVAKPFGSRLGPPKRLVNLEISGQASPVAPTAFANLSFFPGDFDKPAQNLLSGIGNVQVLKSAYTRLPNPQSGVNASRPSIFTSSPAIPDACKDPLSGSFLCMTSAPTLYEGLFWNAFPNPEGAFSPIEENMIPRSLLVGPILSRMSDYYWLQDRMPVPTPPANINQWHFTSYIGDWPDLQVSGKPYFYANEKTAFSSWSPIVSSDAAKSSSQDVGGAGKEGGRMGYQIKLSSIREACADYNFSYCSTDEGKGILH